MQPTYTIERYRYLASKLLTVACVRDDGVSMRRAADPTYQLITEHRGSMERGSLDLATWLLYRLGVRSAWLLRAEHQGWARPSGEYMESWPVLRQPSELDRYRCGDLLRIGVSPHDHVVCVLETDTPVVHSAEYTPGGAELVNRTLSHRHGVPHLGGLRVGYWVPLEVALDHAASRGELAAPDEDALAQLCDTAH